MFPSKIISLPYQSLTNKLCDFIIGIIGIILASFVLALINYNTLDLNDFPYTNPTVPIKFISLALFLMVALGTIIGLIPAQRAVSIKPIDALREE